MLATIALFSMMLISSITIGDDKKPNPVAQELKKFEGTWVLQKATFDGQVLLAEPSPLDLFIFEGNTMINKRDNEQTSEGTIVIDPAKKAIDFNGKSGESKGQNILGIYEVNKDRMTLCISRGNNRPSKLECKEGTKFVLMVLKRQKNK